MNMPQIYKHPEWKTYKIGDLCKISSSKRIFAKEYKDSGIPFYRGKEIIEKQKGNKISTELYISQERYDEIKAKHGVPQMGDMLLTSVGTLGIPYIVQDEVFYFKDGNLTWFYNFEGLDSRYLYYWFLSPIGKMNIDSKAIGSTQKALTIETLSKFEISLPSLEEQRRIAGILGAIDDKIENNRRINTNLELQAQALYKQWFVDNRNDDWEERPLSEIIFFQEGPGIRNWQYVEKKGVRFINIRCINDGDVNVQNANMISENEACGKYAHFLLKPLDIVMSCSGTLGRYAIIRQEHLPLCLNTSVIRFRPAKCIEDYSFVYGYLSSTEFLNKQEEMACGSVQANFGPTHLKQIKIQVPPKDYRTKYNNVVMPIITAMLKNRTEMNMLSSLRDALLPKLMNGEIKIAE